MAYCLVLIIIIEERIENLKSWIPVKSFSQKSQILLAKQVSYFLQLGPIFTGVQAFEIVVKFNFVLNLY